MKKYIFSILAMSALVIAACNKELTENDQIVSEEPGVEYEFTASIDEDTPETSASIDFVSTGKMTWTGSDQIAVWNASTNAFVVFSVKSVSADGYTATFNANISGTPSFGKAYYPASIAGSSENSVVLPSSYASVAAVAEGFPMMSDTVTPGQPVTFKHLGSFLKLTLTGLPAGSDNLTVTASGASLAGTFTTSFNGGAPTLTATSGTASLTVPATSGDNTVYLPVPAGTYGFEIVVKNSSGRNLFRKSASSRTFSRATLKSLKPLAYAAPRLYFARTVSASKYWDADHIMLQGSANNYEVWVNCDGGTVSYIYDEYNIGNDVTGVGKLAQTAMVNDGNKYKIEYNTSTGNAAMTYISGTYNYPYNWNNLYVSTLYLHGTWDGSNWTDSYFAAYDNGNRANHVFEATLTTSATSGEFGLQASGDWWSAYTGDANYGTVTSGAAGVYYCTLVKGSTSNERLTNLPAGTYKVYANVLHDTYGDRPIRVMFVKQ